jgi:hypothetical protein
MAETWQPTQSHDIVMYGIRLMNLSLTRPLTILGCILFVLVEYLNAFE